MSMRDVISPGERRANPSDATLAYYDMYWLVRLTTAELIEAAFVLADIGALLSCPEPRERYIELPKATPMPHRASADAVRICAAL